MSAGAISPPWIDGEKIPDDRIREIFRQPPGVPSTFYRSSLVIGSRGVGKTTLFRYHKEIHDGVAVHLSLATEFASLTKQTALGPLALEYPPSLHRLLIGKATSLLALGIAERLTRKNVSPPVELLLQCLPTKAHAGSEVVAAEWLAQAKNIVARMPLEMFDGISEAHPLPVLATALGQGAERARGPLLLLLDRADMVLVPSLVPVFELLDQSSHYTCLVAMRPGHAGEAIAGIADSVVAGDHYAVVHLGIEPRSQEWIEFVEGAVEAQIGSRLSLVAGTIKALISTVSRDSLRTALELSARYLSVPHNSANSEIMAALEDLRENQLAAAQRTLQKYHRDFRRVVNELRAEVVRLYGSIIGPVVLSVEESGQESLFNVPSRLNRFLDIALRSGAVCMPETQRWVPGLRPTKIEIPPLLLWEKGEIFDRYRRSSPIVIKRLESELFRAAGGPAKPPSIFIAYRMRFEESQHFRSDLEECIHAHPDLSHLKVTDGSVPAGAVWPDVIRERIRSAKAVVGDVTGMRNDVLFELGFAYGLKTLTIPVVAEPSDRSVLPRWVGATQIGHYGDRGGLMGIVASIATHLSDPEFARTSRPPQPIPGLAVWLRELKWNRHALDQFTAAAGREGLKAEVFGAESPDESVIRRAASASLLLVSLDGTEGDALMHFVCGTVVATPKAGHGTLHRVIVIFEEPAQSPRISSLIADSLRRCKEIVQIVPLDQVREETERFGRNYKNWFAGPKKGRKD